MSAPYATGPIKTTPISISSSGDNSVVSAVSGKAIRVFGLILTAAGAVDLTMKSATGGGATAISGVFQILSASDRLILSPYGGKWADTVSGEALNFSLSGAVAVKGQLIYQEIIG